MNLLTSYRRAQNFIMGAADSKLVFKQDIFKLCAGTTIPADDPYWKGVGQKDSAIDTTS